jgi:hypothetical protein
MDGSFNDIDVLFSEIELFLQTFPDDKNINKASIELVVATFSSIESAIGFLIKSVREFFLFPFLFVSAPWISCLVSQKNY